MLAVMFIAFPYVRIYCGQTPVVTHSSFWPQKYINNTIFVNTLSRTVIQIYIGICRLLYPFFGGLLLYRLSKLRINLKRGAMTWCSLAVVITLVIPHIGGETHQWLNGLYCAVVILLVYPAIVAAGAGSPLEGKKTIAVCKFLGMISYPLYITHYPMIYVQMNWAAQHADAPLGTHIWVAVSIFIASVAVAYASVKVYDLPVRAWLSEKFIYNRKNKQK